MKQYQKAHLKKNYVILTVYAIWSEVLSVLLYEHASPQADVFKNHIVDFSLIMEEKTSHSPSPPFDA